MFSEEHGHQADEQHEKPIYMSYHEDDYELEADYVEAMVAQDDPDAQLVQSFEAEFEDFIQETPELHQAMITYVEARQKLLDKRKVRGFWPPKGTGKGGFKGKWQKGKGGRQGLLARIARSTCRICNQKGTWQAECPLRNSTNQGAALQSSSTSATANFAIPEDAELEEPEIFLDGDFSEEDSVAVCFTAVGSVASCVSSQEHVVFNTTENRLKLRNHLHRASLLRRHAAEYIHASKHPCLPNKFSLNSHAMNKPNQTACDRSPQLHRNLNLEKIKTMPILQASDEKGTHAILDTGASRCIIGSSVLCKLLQRLPEAVRSSIKERPSQIKFRFGNNQTLTSQKRMYFPFLSQSHERVWLGVEVVEGSTPFLFSKRAFKQLGGILDTTTDRCTMSRLQKTIDLETNATGLYVMDIVEFCRAPCSSMHVPESFVGHTCHDEKPPCFAELPKPSVIPCWKGFSSFKMLKPNAGLMTLPEPCAKTSSFGPNPDETPQVPFPVSFENGDACPDDQHVERGRQCHHGDTDLGPPAVNEPDRNEPLSGGRRDASSDVPTTGSNVLGAEPSTQSASGDCRVAKTPRWRPHGKPRQDRSSSRPRRGLIFGDQLWHQINRAADSQTKSSGWSSTSTTGDRWHSFGTSSSSARGRSCTRRESNSNDIGTKDHGPSRQPPDTCTVGTEEDCLGKEAHRQDLLPNPVRGHGLSAVESSPISIAASSTTGLRGLLLCPAGERCAGGQAECPEQPVLNAALKSPDLDPMISWQIEDCRIACSRFEPYHAASKQDENVFNALESAIQVADQVVAQNPPDKIQTPEFQPIRKLTQQAMFDMCAFGLKIPKTNTFIKKRSQIWTSSSEVHQFLDQRNCLHDHDHQVIAGSIRHAGESIRLSRFCATYCRGFAVAMAHVLHSVPTVGFAYAAEDEPPQKRIRTHAGAFKKRRIDTTAESEMLSTGPNALGSKILPDDSLWHEAFRMANQLAPRVGNTKFEAGTDLYDLVQGLLDSNFKLSCVFVCRGTDRLQTPVNAPMSQHAPWRHVMSLHRETGKIHDLGCHGWHQMTRAQRIAKSLPSRLTITMFGSQTVTASSMPESPDHVVPEVQSDETREYAQRVRAEGISRSTVMLPDVCEGWAPPPTPLHGPNFRSLDAQEISQLVLLHKNLGHPDPKILANHLQHQGAPDHVVKGAQDFVCDACVETRKPAHQRPAKLQHPIEFNDRIGLDAFYWTGKGKFQCYVIHVCDEASGFHSAKRLDGQNMDRVMDDVGRTPKGSVS